MENTEITLNGTDWSNLYIIDYAGGCGGEMMCDILSDKVDAQFTSPQTPLQSFSDDSFGNMYTSPARDLLNLAFVHRYRGYKCKEIITAEHSDDTIKHNLKLNIIHQDKDATKQVEYWMDIEKEIDLAVRNTRLTKNYILRTHRNRDWSSFTNANVIRIYPEAMSHLTWSLVMLKRWVTPRYAGWKSSHQSVDVDDWKIGLTIDKLEWIISNIFSETPNTLYDWQCELIMTDRLDDFNWDSFVEDIFAYQTFDEADKNSISGEDWVFGTGESVPIAKTAGVDISTDAIKSWQQGNIDLLVKHGITMTSTKEECVNYFKNYWNINKIPCVTEI